MRVLRHPSAPPPSHAPASVDLSVTPSESSPRRRVTDTPLTDTQARQAKPRDVSYRLCDGQGLSLLVQPSGAKWWRFDYLFVGTRKTISLGTYPTVTLAKARDRRLEARRLVADGVDPSKARKDAKAKLRDEQAITFRFVAKEWLKKQHLAPRTIVRIEGFLTRDVYPAIGRLPISSVSRQQMLSVLRTVEERGCHHTAHRLRQVCGQVFRYAMATHRADRDPCEALSDALTSSTARHYAAVTTPKEIGALMRAIDGLKASASVMYALRLAPLVFVRPGELRAAEWREIDLEAAIWRVPSDRIKTREDHLVPLSRQALAILTTLRDLTPGQLVFPTSFDLKRHIADVSLNKALRRIGYPPARMTMHGFRAMARTHLDEHMRFPPDVIEVQLGHRVRGPLGSAYNRSQYVEQRTLMMQAYADDLDRLRTLR